MPALELRVADVLPSPSAIRLRELPNSAHEWLNHNSYKNIGA